MKRIIGSALCVFLILSSLTSCISPWVWQYFTEEGVFRTQDGSFAIDFRYGAAVLQTDEENLEFDCGVRYSRLYRIEFIKHIPYDGLPHGITEDMILMYADVEANKKTKTLTLTVTGGTLEEYVGNVYVLEFYPDEELIFDDAVETREGAADSGKIEGKN